MLKQMSVILASMMVAGSALAANIIWDDQNFVAGGNDCKKNESVFALAAGDEISFIMTDLGSNLSGYAGGRLEERKFCNIMIRATVKQGFYLARLTHRILGGFVRTGNAEGKVSVVSTFYNNRVRPISLSTNDYASDHVPVFSKQSSTDFVVTPRYCLSDYKGVMRSNLIVTAHRDSLEDGMVIQADSYDVKFDTIAEIFRCP